MKEYLMLDFAAVKVTPKTEFDPSMINKKYIYDVIRTIHGTSNFELWYEMLLIINVSLVIGKITIEEAVELGKLLSYISDRNELLSSIVHFWRNKPEGLFSQYHEIINNTNHWFCSKSLNYIDNKFWGNKMFEILSKNTIKPFIINDNNAYMSEYTSKVRKQLLMNYITHNIDEIKNGNVCSVDYSCLERYITLRKDHDENGLYKVLLRCWNKEQLKDQEKKKISQEEKREITKKLMKNLKRGEAKKIYLTDVK